MRYLALIFVGACGLAGCKVQFIEHRIETSIDEKGVWRRSWTTRAYRETPTQPGGGDLRETGSIVCQVNEPCEQETANNPRCPSSELDAIRHRIKDEDCGGVLKRISHRGDGKLPDKPRPDFVMKKSAQSSERTASNDVSLARYDLGLMVIYSYREVFRGFLTPGDFVDVGGRAFDRVADFALEILRSELKEDFDLTKIEAYIAARKHEIKELIAIAAFTSFDEELLTAEAVRRARVLGIEVNKKTPEKQIEETVARWYDEQIRPLLVPLRAGAPSPTAGDLASESYKKHIDETYNERKEAFVEEMEEEFKPWLEMLPFVWGEHMELALKYHAPGRVVHTNGAVGGDGQIEWRFRPTEFRLLPHEVTAVSVVTNDKALRRFPAAELSGVALSRLTNGLSGLSDAQVATLRKAALAPDHKEGLTDLWCNKDLATADDLLRLLGEVVVCPSQVDVGPH